jgi:hypothetical protein
MRCKYCKSELKGNSKVCPKCGKANKEKDLEKSLRIMKILVFCLSGIILAAILVGIISYGTTGSFLPGKKENEETMPATAPTTAPTQPTTAPTEPRVPPEDSYSVTVDELNTPDGNKEFLGNRDTVVATMGEHTLTNRLLQIYYWDLVTASKYADLDKTKPLDMQYQDPANEKTWQDFFVEKAIDTWQRDVLLVEMAKKENYKMPEVYTSQFETLEKDMTATATSKNYTTLSAFLESMLGRGTTFESYYDYLWTYFLGGSYWADYIEKVEVNTEELDAYFEAHKNEMVLDGYFRVTKESGKLVDVRHILIKPTGGKLGEDGKTTVYSEEEWAACQKKAQAILDEWLAGDATEATFATLATKNTEDAGSKANGGLYVNTWKGKMVKEFDEWCFDESRETGDYSLVKTTHGYHIMYFVGSEEGWIRMSTPGAQSDKATAMMDEIVEKATVDIDLDKIVLADLM